MVAGEGLWLTYNWIEVIDIEREIKEADPAEGHRALGMLYAKDKDYRLAEQEYKSAIEKSDGRVSYWYELGLFYRDEKKIVMAFSGVPVYPV